MTIKTNIKAGPYLSSDCPRWRCGYNHNETQVQERTRGLQVKTNIKAGPHIITWDPRRYSR